MIRTLFVFNDTGAAVHLARRTPLLVLALLLAVPLVVLRPAPADAATVRRVPSQYATIQAAVNASVDGDTVLVAPGTYTQRFDYNGKSISVQSASGAASTILDGGRGGTVVTMQSAPGKRPVLRGFTIRNGYGLGEGNGKGAAVHTGYGEAVIEQNRITGNQVCFAAVNAVNSAATIRNNVISGNTAICTGGPGGGGILLSAPGPALIANNTITGNVSASSGGGIEVAGSEAVVVSGNTISGNRGGSGGGIDISGSPTVVNNIIVGNTATAYGSAISWMTSDSDRGPLVVNNTMAGNTGMSTVNADGFDAAARLTNNLIVGSGPSPVVRCGDFNDLNPPVITYNDVVSTDGGPRYGGICTERTGTAGNISAAPLWRATGDYHLAAGSPGIDAGTGTGAPATDVDGDARPLDGNGDGTAVLDMGADEARDTTPPTVRCTATPGSLTPPDHRLVPVTVAVTATDGGGPVTVRLTSVISSQLDGGLGAGDLTGDIGGWTVGADDRSGSLRAERYAKARTYTLRYSGTDAAGNVGACATNVHVPL
jgi:parallel beta-helix repeat protein